MVERHVHGVPARRAVLGWLGGALLCPICVAKQASASGDGAHWSYEGDTGPGAWGAMTGANRVCSMGMEQTPIDLIGATRAQLAPVEIVFQPNRPTVVNNGHTIQANCEPGSFTVINGTRYDLLQFHFHHPSEHLLSGRSFDLECHFVHKSASGGLAVVGVFLRPGLANATLDPLWSAMPAEAGAEAGLGAAIDLTGLLPVERGFFRYAGSLTTPPCSEGLVWTVFKSPVDVSDAQVRRFADLFPMNARPVQPLHRRFLLETA